MPLLASSWAFRPAVPPASFRPRSCPTLWAPLKLSWPRSTSPEPESISCLMLERCSEPLFSRDWMPTSEWWVELCPKARLASELPSCDWYGCRFAIEFANMVLPCSSKRATEPPAARARSPCAVWMLLREKSSWCWFTKCEWRWSLTRCCCERPKECWCWSSKSLYEFSGSDITLLTVGRRILRQI